MLGICEQDFKYSNGWLEKFKKRFGISIKTLAGEAGSVDLELFERERMRLIKILDKYEAKNRFNMDETALYYKLPPNKTLGTNERSNSGKKQSKDRLTIGLCCNQTGDEYIKPLIINKSRKPHCFGRFFNPNSIVSFYCNQKAWMTMVVFEDWLVKLNSQFLRQDRKLSF